MRQGKFLISGSVMALCLMLGVAVGASQNAIKQGIIGGLLFGIVVSALIILWIDHRKR